MDSRDKCIIKIDEYDSVSIELTDYGKLLLVVGDLEDPWGTDRGAACISLEQAVSIADMLKALARKLSKKE